MSRLAKCLVLKHSSQKGWLAICNLKVKYLGYVTHHKAGWALEHVTHDKAGWMPKT